MKQSDLTKEEFLQECYKLLDDMGKDYSGDTINCYSGDLSVICNPNSKYADLFGGYSIYEVCNFVAEETGKKVILHGDY